MIDPNFTVKQGEALDQAIRDGNRLADALVKSRAEVLDLQERLATAVRWLRRLEAEYPGCLNEGAIERHITSDSRKES